MDEQATFETRAVLAPRRARGARLALLVPVVALIAIAWAGLSGPRADAPTAATAATAAPPVPTTSAGPAAPIEAAYPMEVIGLAVQRLGELQIGGLGRDAIVAIAGWYVPTAITDCAPLAGIFGDGSLPFVHGAALSRAFCVRSGVLYPSRPDLSTVVPTGVAVTVVVGVVMPGELEAVDTQATQVVVVGRFSKSSDGCLIGVGCSRELVIEHVAWTPGAG